MFETLLDLAPSDRKRPVHLLCNDTLVESPVLMAYIDRMLARLQSAAESLHLPITVVKTTPDPDQTFWVNLIGRVTPPTRMFRWCTDRMKIAPTSNYIRTQISQNGEVVLLLGVRRAESANRAVTMNRHRKLTGTRLNPHDDMKGCMVFRPIMDMTTDDVWLLLLHSCRRGEGTTASLSLCTGTPRAVNAHWSWTSPRLRPAAPHPPALAAGHAPWWKRTVVWRQ